MNELVLMLLFGWSAAERFQPAALQADRPQPAPAPVVAVAAPAQAAKHVIVFFTASWCPSCVRMKSQTLPNVSLPGHELRVVDVDANPGLVQSYGVQSIPAYFVLDGMGRVYRQGVGFRDVAQFVAFLNGR